MDEERQEMRARFWGMFQTIKFKERFYACHDRHSYRCNLVYGAITLFVSIASALIWSISNKLPALWALVIAAAQLAQSLKDSLPWAQRLSALKFFMPEVRSLLLDIEDTWNDIDLEDDQWGSKEINAKRSEYDRAFAALEQKYIDSVHFPKTDKINEEAQKETDVFFDNRYHIAKE